MECLPAEHEKTSQNHADLPVSCANTGSGLLPLRGRAPEKAHVIPIEGGVIRKAATGTDRGGTLPLRKHFSGHHEAFFADVLLGCLVQLLLEKAEEVALAHVESV